MEIVTDEILSPFKENTPSTDPRRISANGEGYVIVEDERTEVLPYDLLARFLPKSVLDALDKPSFDPHRKCAIDEYSLRMQFQTDGGRVPPTNEELSALAERPPSPKTVAELRNILRSENPHHSEKRRR